MNSIYDKLKQTLKQAESHNSSLMVKPEVILWPDPESQWLDVIPVIQKELPQLLIYGNYDTSKKQGPAIWIKCMVAKTLPDANWENTVTPIIYLPGISKNDFRNAETASPALQPLLEYQYTGTLFTQENGKEWTILALVENVMAGTGGSVSKDMATKNALKKALPSIFQEEDFFNDRSFIDADYLNYHLFPDLIPSILKWMCKGDIYLHSMEQNKKEVFLSLCQSQYGFLPDGKNIKYIAEKLGTQSNYWKQVWQFYAAAPHKFPEIEHLLRSAKPTDLGTGGIFAIPEDSWPQVNEGKEEELRKAFNKASKPNPIEALALLNSLEKSHQIRRTWVWYELGQSPLVDALQYLCQMAVITTEPFPYATIEELRDYYTSKGYLADQAMRKSLAAVKSDKDKTLIKSLINTLYEPWLKSITKKFQSLVEKNASIFTSQTAIPEIEQYVLFVDAFRFELAEEFRQRLLKSNYLVTLDSDWSAIPTLTPTAKPNVSPIAAEVSVTSDIKEFRPQLNSGKDLLTTAFRDALAEKHFKYISAASDINPEEFCWQEIGDIDTKGHEEQSDMVKRIEELFDQVQDIIDTAFEKGVKRIKIVTDHGWLLLPGGLPKTALNEGLTEERWGRCALIKKEANTDLLNLPWRWNPSIYIAYAPGISFFKINEEYAHGGISIHECLVPTLIVENQNKPKSNARIQEIKWINLKCAVATENAEDGFTIDIRTKYNDEKSSIVLSTNMTVRDNKGSVMVNDEAESQAATIVLLDECGIILDKKLTTVGG